MIYLYFLCKILCDLEFQLSVNGYMSLRGVMPPESKKRDLNFIILQQTRCKRLVFPEALLVDNCEYSYRYNTIHGLVNFRDFANYTRVLQKNAPFHKIYLTTFYNSNLYADTKDECLHVEIIGADITNETVKCIYDSGDLIRDYIIYYFENLLQPEIRAILDAFQSSSVLQLAEARFAESGYKMKTSSDFISCLDFLKRNLNNLLSQTGSEIMDASSLFGSSFYNLGPRRAWEMLQNCIKCAYAIKSIYFDREIQDFDFTIAVPNELNVVKVFTITVNDETDRKRDIDALMLNVQFYDSDDKEIKETQKYLIFIQNKICVPIYILKQFNIRGFVVKNGDANSDKILVDFDTLDIAFD